MTKKKLLKQEGVTLLELLIAISLMGLIFALGMYPMLSQITLFREQRSDITLFDDANLAVNYIIKDAMKAEGAYDATPNEIVFTINAVSLGIGADPSTKTFHSVYYYQTGGDELHREHWDYAPAAKTVPPADRTVPSVAGGTRLSDRIITSKLASSPTFTLVTNPNTQQHQLNCAIDFQDPDDASITTERNFEVMLRCKDARTP